MSDQHKHTTQKGQTMSTRMTVSTMEFVAKSATNAIYSSKITSIRDEMTVIADELYSSLFTDKHLQIMEEYHYLFPKYQKLRISPFRLWENDTNVVMSTGRPVTGDMICNFTIISHIQQLGSYKSTDGNEYSASTLKPEYIQMGMDNLCGTYVPLVCKHLRDFMQKQKERDTLYSEKTATYHDIMQRLRSYSTVKQAYDNWPEIRQFLPSVKNPDKVTTCSTTDKLLREVQNGRKDQNQQKG